ncbi:MAG: alkaline phosphatase family protein [Acidobacteriota bacterium]|nr:alkaline phosphatase family protein [Acidobacteriota bacterium]
MSRLSSLRRRLGLLYHQRPGWVDVLLCGLLPGMLAGIQLAGLLLFLNPHLGRSPGTLVPLALVYGGALGLAGLLVQLPATFGHPYRARRLLPWGLTLALLAAAVLNTVQASYYAFYLAPGINSRLIKAGLVLAVTALVAFYTALLHSLHRRRYGRRSRIGFMLLVFASFFVMVERLQSYELRPEASRTAAAAGERPRLRMVTVALEGATLDAILPLAEQGRVPFLATMLREGAGGRLETLSPNRRPAVWTSLFTGKNPYRHEILGDATWSAPMLGEDARLRLLPAGVGFEHWGLWGMDRRPVTRAALRPLSLAQILARLGAPAATVGWPLTTPPAPELRFSLAESFFTPAPTLRSAQPPDVTERARLFRPEPAELEPELVKRFGGPLPPPLLQALEGDVWRQGLSLFLVDQSPEVSGLFIALPGLGEVSRQTFSGYAEVQFEGGGDEEARRAHEQLAAYYGQLDTFLDALWQRLPEPRLLAVVSPYGADALGLVPRWWQGLTQGSTVHGSLAGDNDGVLLLYGDDIRPGARLADAQLVDVVPTLLYAFGYSIAKDLDGKVLTAAFTARRTSRQPLSVVPTYDALPIPDQP